MDASRAQLKMVFEVLRGSFPFIVSLNELFMFVCFFTHHVMAAERLLHSLLMDLFVFTRLFTTACKFNYKHLVSE